MTSFSYNPQQPLIERATPETSQEDWSLFLSISDQINDKPDIATDICTALNKRLQHKHSSVVLLSLSLLESIVKNTGQQFHSHFIHSTELSTQLSQLAQEHADVTVKHRSATLIQEFALTFPYSVWWMIYEQLNCSGSIVFPEVERRVPILTPPPTVNISSSNNNTTATSQSSIQFKQQETQQANNTATNSNSSSRNVSPSFQSNVHPLSSFNAEFFNKTQQDFRQVYTYLQLLVEMLETCNSADALKSNDALQSILALLNEVKGRLIVLVNETVSECSNTDFNELCLQVFEDVNRVLVRCTAFAAAKGTIDRKSIPKVKLPEALQVEDTDVTSACVSAASAGASISPPYYSASSPTTRPALYDNVSSKAQTPVNTNLKTDQINSNHNVQSLQQQQQQQREG